MFLIHHFIDKVGCFSILTWVRTNSFILSYFFPRSSRVLECLECLSLTSECWQIWWICCHHLGGLMGKAFPRGDGLHISLLLLVGKAGKLILLNLIVAIRSWSSHSSLHSRLLLVQSIFLESFSFSF